MEKILKSRWYHLGVAGVIAVAVLIVYSNTFTSSFHFDDTPVIVENYQLRDLSNLPQILTGQRGFTMATFALNYAVGGLNVTGYHIVNILIHMTNGILAYFLLFYTLTRVTGDELWGKRIAAYAALLFAVHPVQTQAVTYIVQRMESLSSLFYLLALLLFVKAVKAGPAGKRGFLYGGVALSYLLGLYSKEIAITLPAVVLLYDVYFIGGSLKNAISTRWPVYGAMAFLLIFFAVKMIIPMGGFGDLSEESSGHVAVQTTAPSAGFGVKSISPKEYLFTQFNVIVYYISLLAVPVNQNLDYDFPVSTGLFEVPQVKEGTVLNIPIPPPVVSLVILLGIIALAAYLYLKSRKSGDKRGLVVSFFIFWFFIILSPTSSFIPIIDVIFEHRLYLASLGFFVVFAVCFDWFFEWLALRSAARSEARAKGQA